MRRGRLSLFQKLMFFMIATVAVPMIWSEVRSNSTISNILEKQEALEMRDSVNLTANNIDGVMRSLVLQILGLCQDEDVIEIAEELKAPYISAEKMNQLKLRFIDRSDQVMQVDRVYKLDMRIYTMLAAEGEYGLFNFTCQQKEFKECLSELKKKTTKNPYTIRWLGLLNNYDAYHFKHEANLIVLGMQLDNGISQGEEAMLWMGVTELAFRKSLIPDGSKIKDVFLLDENYTILSAGHPEYVGRSMEEFLDTNLFQMDEGQMIGVDTSEGKVILTYKKLDNCPWMIVDMSPYQNVLSKVTEINQNRFMVNIIYIMVFMIIAAFLVDQITRPLRWLQKEMQEFQPGEEVETTRKSPSFMGKEVSQLYQCYYNMTGNISELMVENERIQKKKREAELRALQAQIKPHFLFNTLMSIRCAIGNGNSKKASDMALYLSKLLRNTIVKGEEVVPLKEEISIINTYICLQNMRSYQQIQLWTDIRDNLEDFRIPKLLLQPMVENAIVHGFEERETGEIRLSACIKDGKVELVIRDNGKGFSENPLDHCSESVHFGVYSVKNRLQLYYGNNGEIRYESDEGTIVTITVPIDRR